MKEHFETRQPIVQGLFYPDTQKETNITIKKLLEQNPGISEYSHLVLPHGAWDFIGNYLALGFNSLEKKNYKRIIIISNVHREENNKIYIPQYRNFGIWDTTIPIDTEGIKKIDGLKGVCKTNIPHDEENSIEICLPFIKYLYPEAKIIPVLLGKTIVSLTRNLGEIVKALYNSETLIIITTNFSSYQKNPVAMDIGLKGIEATLNGKISENIELCRTNKLEICSYGSIAGVLLTLEKGDLTLLKAGLSDPGGNENQKGTYIGALGIGRK